MWQSFLNPFFWEKEAKSLSWRYCIRKSELLTKVKVNKPVTAEEKVLVEAENSMKEPDKEAVKESAAEEAAAKRKTVKKTRKAGIAKAAKNVIKRK